MKTTTPSTDVRVHVLSAGVALCEFTRLAPADWPPGHVFVGIVHTEKLGVANCPRCQERLLEVGIEVGAFASAPLAFEDQVIPTPVLPAVTICSGVSLEPRRDPMPSAAEEASVQVINWEKDNVPPANVFVDGVPVQRVLRCQPGAGGWAVFMPVDDGGRYMVDDQGHPVRQMARGNVEVRDWKIPGDST